MIEDTPEQKEVIRERQRLCKHDFSFAARATRLRAACTAGSLKQMQEQMTPYVGTAVGFNWAPP